MHTDALSWLRDLPDRQGATLFLRSAEHEGEPPDSTDLDLLVFDAAEEICVERIWPPSGPPSLDLLRLPAALLRQPERLASFGLITQRLLTSTLVADPSGLGAQAQDQARELCWEPAHQRARLASFLEMAQLTVREVGVSWSFPAQALFWLHMTHAACFAAMFDAARRFCPNIYTRPLLRLPELEALVGTALIEPMIEALRLKDDPASLEPPLRAMQHLVARRCSEPAWPATIGEGTRAEYRYWIARGEVETRINAAREMAAGGSRVGAVFYLRYCAYSLARVAMIHQRVAEGSRLALSFIRPEREVGPDLLAHHPDLYVLLSKVLSGPQEVTLEEVHCALARIQQLRRVTQRWLAQNDLGFDGLPEWQPHRPPG
jgi:hypothetical protein